MEYLATTSLSFGLGTLLFGNAYAAEVDSLPRSRVWLPGRSVLLLLAVLAVHRLGDPNPDPRVEVDAWAAPGLAGLERDLAGFTEVNASELRITRKSCRVISKVNRHLNRALGWAWTHLKDEFTTSTKNADADGERVALMHPLDFHLTTDPFNRTLNQSAVLTQLRSCNSPQPRCGDLEDWMNHTRLMVSSWETSSNLTANGQPVAQYSSFTVPHDLKTLRDIVERALHSCKRWAELRRQHACCGSYTKPAMPGLRLVPRSGRWEREYEVAPGPGVFKVRRTNSSSQGQRGRVKPDAAENRIMPAPLAPGPASPTSLPPAAVNDTSAADIRRAENDEWRQLLRRAELRRAELRLAPYDGWRERMATAPLGERNGLPAMHILKKFGPDGAAVAPNIEDVTRAMYQAAVTDHPVIVPDGTRVFPGPSEDWVTAVRFELALS